MDEQSQEIATLVTLHAGLDRLGPGDEAFSREILGMLPALPSPPRIADLGCGTGSSALLLAAYFQCPVKAVDLHPVFLDDLMARARDRSLNHLISPIAADMGNLNWPNASIDLLWSEGAAYNLTFAGALTAWRPLLAPGGVAVISELSWFTPTPPAAAREFWQAGYPAMGSETENVAHAVTAGYQVLETRRLPIQAWWENYYEPLLERMEVHRGSSDPVMRAVLADTDLEINLFREHGDAYGYTFYVLRKD